MSTLMRSWIDAVVEEELPVAAECFKGKSLARGPVRSDRRLWDAHGLTIELHRGRHLQVLEVRSLFFALSLLRLLLFSMLIKTYIKIG